MEFLNDDALVVQDQDFLTARSVAHWASLLLPCIQRIIRISAIGVTKRCWWIFSSSLISNFVFAASTGTCSNGVDGTESDNGKYCCLSECSACAGAGCGSFGPECCASDIEASGNLCSETGEAPCLIDGGALNGIDSSYSTHGKIRGDRKWAILSTFPSPVGICSITTRRAAAVHQSDSDPNNRP